MESQINKITNNQLDQLVISGDFPANSLGISMTYSYFSKLVDLNWYDMIFAIKNGFLSHQSAIEHAIIELEKNEDCSQIVFDLACLSPNEAIHAHSIHPYIDKLADGISEPEKSKTKNKLMYVLLNWVFERKECYADPLKVVELIYDDFGFPSSIAHFVRYKPTEQPLLATVEENIERLYDNWKIFLDTEKARYSGRRPRDIVPRK